MNLSIEEKLVCQIKEYAEEKNTSVSELVEQYFKRLTRPAKKSNLIELVKSLPKVDLGYDDDVDLKKQYYQERASKYGF
jgi:hypothetical protein